MNTSESITTYVGTGRYWRTEGPRDSIELVLAATKKGDSIDFVVTVPDATTVPAEDSMEP